MPILTWNDTILQLMRDYYALYYRDTLGHKDWQKRVEHRLTEEANASRFIERVEEWLQRPIGNGDKVLVVGAGTGAEYFAFAERGCEVYGVEPDPPAVEIGRLKAQSYGTDPTRFMEGVGEKIPFPEDTFDFVWCFSVIEHVQDVEKTLNEMIRVVRPAGYVHIITHDYRQFYEGHYKLTFPMALPKWMFRLYLRAVGRPTAYLSTLQFVTSRQITNIVQQLPVTAFYIITPWSQVNLGRRSIQARLVKWMVRWFGIQREQKWLIQKLPK